MLSIVIPTLNAAATLPHCLAALVPAMVEGLLKEVIIADGGSDDETAMIAEAAGARFIRGEAGRGRQLAAGAAQAREDWLLFLHADTVLEPEWIGAARAAMAHISDRQDGRGAAYFRLALDDPRRRARLMEALVAARCSLLGLPYGDQGLLIRRDFHAACGGFRPLVLMEDVDLARRIGRRRLLALETRAVTSAARYHRSGYVRRTLRNIACLTLFRLGADPAFIKRVYEK
jgi:rSAM/selenodomain-associated transferase 2